MDDLLVVNAPSLLPVYSLEPSGRLHTGVHRAHLHGVEGNVLVGAQGRTALDQLVGARGIAARCVARLAHLQRSRGVVGELVLRIGANYLVRAGVLCAKWLLQRSPTNTSLRVGNPNWPRLVLRQGSSKTFCRGSVHVSLSVPYLWVLLTVQSL